jgi:4-amino-4-deoxy-L-arabinose transferase-like glycosyltransferase
MAEARVLDHPASAPTGMPSKAAAASRWPFLLILLFGAIVRITLWRWFQELPLHIADENDYNRLATNLVEHQEFSFTAGSLTSLRPPLYPALVAGVYALFGLQNFPAVRLLQAALSLFNTFVLYGLGLEVASRRAALWLAGLFCFYPSFLGFNNLLLTETLFTLLLSLFCYLLVLAYRREALGYLLAAGLILGLATLTRSILWMSPPLLAVFLVATWKGSWLRRGLAVLAVVVPFAIALAPWAYRNSVLERTFVAVDSMGGRNFMMGNYRHTPLYRSWDAISFTGETSWIAEVLAADHSTEPKIQGNTQGQLDKLALKRGLLFVRENPWLTAQRDLIKFFDFWGLERELVAGASRGYFGNLSGLVVALLALLLWGSYAALLFLGIFGMCLAPLADRRLHWLLLSVIAYTCGLHTLVFAHSRYHLPVMPLVLVFAATAITARPSPWRQWRQAGFWLAAALCVLIVVGWGWGLATGDLEKLRETIISAV